jgi:lysozyme family protein
MMKAFDEFFSRVMQKEGVLSMDPADSGNWTGGRVGHGELKGTKYGISAAAFPSVEIKTLTMEQARSIYHSLYWQAPGFWRLPGPLATRVADVGVTSGPHTAIKMLQRAVNAVCAGDIPARRRAPWRQQIAQLLGGGVLLVDGRLGPITTNVIAACPYHTALQVAFNGEAYLHYRRLNPLYIPGWLERLGS